MEQHPFLVGPEWLPIWWWDLFLICFATAATANFGRWRRRRRLADLFFFCARVCVCVCVVGPPGPSAIRSLDLKY